MLDQMSFYTDTIFESYMYCQLQKAFQKMRVYVYQFCLAEYTRMVATDGIIILMLISHYNLKQTE